MLKLLPEYNKNKSSCFINPIKKLVEVLVCMFPVMETKKAA